jgi:hypothetical protein
VAASSQQISRNLGSLCMPSSRIKVGTCTSIRIFWAYYFEYPVTLEKQSHRMRVYVG